MMMRPVLTFGILLAVLAGCGTPQERCIASASREVRILDRLMGEVQGNLDRGYALEEVVQSQDRWVVCKEGTAATDTTPAVAPEMCWRTFDRTVTRPKAINLADERQTLAEMQKKRLELVRGRDKAVASCKLTHPE